MASESKPLPEVAVAATLATKGDLYRTANGQLYYHLKKSKGGLWDEIIRLDPANQRLRTLAMNHGINPASQPFLRLVERMKGQADGHGSFAEIFHISCHRGGSIYVDRGWSDNRPAGEMWKITSDGIAVVPHGTDGVVFEVTSRTRPIEASASDCTPQCSIGGLLRLPRMLGAIGLPTFGGGRLTQAQALQALVVAIYNLYLDAPTNPILVILGERNSGKTWLAKTLQYLYMADALTMGADGDYRDISGALTNRRLVVIDNFDEGKAKLLDLLARVATGGEESRREFYTTNNQVSYPFMARVVVTQRNAVLARDDLGERLVVLKCAEQTELMPEGKLIERLERLAPVLRGAIMHDLVHILAEIATESEGWKLRFRMADYALLGHYVAKLQGASDEWDATLRCLRMEQLDYLSQASSIVEPVKDFVMSAGHWEGYAGDLYRQLEDHVADTTFTRQVRTPKALSDELWRLRDVLELHGIEVQREEDKAKKQFRYLLRHMIDVPTLLERAKPWRQVAEAAAK